jgi:hypothetical protein
MQNENQIHLTDTVIPLYSEPAYSENPLIVNAFHSIDSIKSILL